MEDGLLGGLIIGLIAVVAFYYQFIRKEEKRAPEPRHYEGIPSAVLKGRLDRRILWSELEEVGKCGVLDEISSSDKVLQESIFELLTSEASFNKSLDVLINFIFCCNQFTENVGAQDLKVLRSNVDEIQRVSNSFLQDLLAKWEDSLYINEIAELIDYYALNGFSVYKEYCGNQPNQEHVFHKLLLKDDFVQMMKRIEENPKCQRLTLDSYLMLPMQRITRFPLLLGAIMKRLECDKEKRMCEEAFQNLTKLVQGCNEAARETQDSLEVHAIITKFEKVESSEDTLGKFIIKEEFVKYSVDPNGNNFRVGGKLNFRKHKAKPCLVILYTHRLFVFRRKSSGKLELLDAVSTKNANVTIKLFPIHKDDVCKEFMHSFVVHFTKEKSFHILGAKLKSQVENWQQKLDSIKGSANTGTARTFDLITRTSSSPS